MPRPPLIVIADDLTGAAEMAALAHRHGLSSSVLTQGHPPTSASDVWVFDTDSRLDSPAVAADKVTRLVPAIRALHSALIYKKPDSVLRGPVRAELEALATALGLSRVLLVPANPTLSRTVVTGHYFIDGTPLHQTAFARDPHHPATTNNACALLGADGSFAVHSGAADQPRPAGGITLGDASNEAELDAWAATSADPTTLLAGAADFFAALLRQRGTVVAINIPPAARPPGPTLVISGTTHPGAAANRRAGPHVVARTAAHAIEVAAWAEELRLRLSQSGLALACFEGPISCDRTLPPALRATLAAVAARLTVVHAFSHLIVEGGATAAAITRTLDWTELRLHHAWAPGVASLVPITAPAFTLTLKPGSYSWPAALDPLSL